MEFKGKIRARVKKNGNSLDVVEAKGNEAYLKVLQWKRVTISYSSGNKIAIDLKGRHCSRLYCRILGPGDDAKKELKFSDYKFAD